MDSREKLTKDLLDLNSESFKMVSDVYLQEYTYRFSPSIKDKADAFDRLLYGIQKAIDHQTDRLIEISKKYI